jgi:hypothetical protein
MPDYGATDRVRRFVAQQFIEPARKQGERTVTVHAGTLGKLLAERNILPPNRFPIICGAMGSPKFAKSNRVRLESRQGPDSGLSSTTTFTFVLEPSEPASSGSSADSRPAPANSADAFLGLRGIMKSAYQKLGGAEAFHRRESEGWER